MQSVANTSRFHVIRMLMPGLVSALFLALILVALPAHAAEDEVYTPAEGDPVRTEILDAVRVEVESWINLEIVLSVTELRVLGDWAWTIVEPSSKDGTQNYETVTALLQKQNGAWTVADIPSCESGDDECWEHFLEMVMENNPEAPAALFPKE